MLARKTVGQIIALHIISVFLISGKAANCINKTVDYKELLKGSLKDTLPNIPLEKFGNKYYYFGAIYQGNFFQAMQYCHYHGMNPLSVESVEENNFLWEKLKPFLGAGEYHFWTSGTTLSDAHWVWLATGRPIIYANWFPTQPDNAGNNEKCLEVRYVPASKTMMWNDHVCTVPKHVICESSQASCVSS
ncbi:perlucin-like [Anoplophora glabripennis]|uniref:perlucin-like n=1 Tax=Anoplophora glabripennis TaxID=217634 RepID=UPI0008744C71|nr:perlucin-like [Anoplophora glabripennis]